MKLDALQWADTAFPSGRYTLSNGLEGVAQHLAAQGGAVDVREFLHSSLHYSFTTTDLAAVALAWEAADISNLDILNTVVGATRTVESVFRASVRVGKQMLFMAGQLGIEVQAPKDCHQAVAAALIHKANGLSLDEALSIEFFAFVSQTASAAVRLGLVDFIQGQKLIKELMDEAPACIGAAKNLKLEDLGSQVPFLEIASARHEHADARLFMN
ncbi:MAG: urease accessory UreF family protein [Corynebacterium sp.]|nr:urease accessory UreF family protein [Corynebacterium sp.]